VIAWFVVCSVAAVVVVFGDPRIDHRLVALGALLPDAVDGITRGGRTGPAHTLLGAVVVLAVVMWSTIGRRPLRKRLLAVPIGWFAHLVLDPAWTATHAFWWPAFGASLPGRIPLLERPLAVTAAMEVAGLVLGVVLWRRWRLTDAAVRARLVRHGELARVVAPARRPSSRQPTRRR
jgi:hypothetical protein